MPEYPAGTKARENGRHRRSRTDKKTPAPIVEPDEGLRGHKRMAHRFASMFAGTFAYTAGRGWLEFNGSYWEQVTDARPWNAVHSVCLAALEELPTITRPDWRDALYKDVRMCDSADGTAGVLKHALRHPKIGKRDEQLDRHANLFVVANGTIDLDTDEYGPSNPRDLMTLAGNVAYDPEATCPLYDELFELYQPDAEVRAYFHRLGGAAMYGEQNLQQLIINYGAAGGNGKGTIQRAWMNVFGSYSKVLDVGVLLARKGYDQYRDDKALLAGKRLLYVTEVAEGQRFDAGTVKGLTGGEPIMGSQKYRSAIEITPSWLIMMSTNNRVRTPKDGGMARRLKEIGWNYKVPVGQELDPTVLDAKLRAEGPGILNRLLEGWRDYRANGVQEPESVTKATTAYLDSVDPISMFLADMVTVREGTRTPSSSVYKAYAQWCTDNGEHPAPARLFSPELEKRGWTKARGSGGMSWVNLAVGEAL